jgi:hypothetical protein
MDRRVAVFFCGIVAVGLGPAIWLGSTLFRAPAVSTPPVVSVTSEATGTPTGSPDPTTSYTGGPLDPPADGGGWPTGPDGIHPSMPGVGLTSTPAPWPSQTPQVTTGPTQTPTTSPTTTPSSGTGTPTSTPPTGTT